MLNKVAKIILFIFILVQNNISFSQQAEGLGKIGYKAFLNSIDKYPAFGTSMEIFDSDSNLVKKHPYWKGIIENLKPGKYTLKASNSGQTKTKTVDVWEDRMQIVNFFFDFETGNIHFLNMIKDVQDSKAYGSITNVLHQTGEPVYTGTRAEGTIRNLPIGEYEVISRNSDISYNKKIQVEENTTKDVIFEFDLGKGRISFRCFLDSLLEKAAYGAKIMIYRMPYNELISPIYTNQWRATTSFLPAGNYSIVGSYQNKTKRLTTHVLNDSTSNINIVFDVQNIRFSYRCYRNQNQEPANGAVLEVYSNTGQLIERGEGWRDTFFLAEGAYKVRATYLGKSYEFDVQISSNDGLRVERDFILE